MRYAKVTLVLTSLACGCHRSPAGEDPEPTHPPPSSPAPAEVPSLAEAEASVPTDASLDSPHRVVFADRTSQGYLLLVSEARTRSFTREDVKALVERELDDPSEEAEAQRLLELVATEPLVEDPKLIGQHAQPLGSPRATTELLGLHLELFPLRRNGKELVGEQHLTDPILTRALPRRARIATSASSRAAPPRRLPQSPRPARLTPPPAPGRARRPRPRRLDSRSRHPRDHGSRRVRAAPLATLAQQRRRTDRDR